MSGFSDLSMQVHSLITLLQTNTDGDDLAHADECYRAVMSALTAHIEAYHGTAKGELTIKASFAADPKGIDVTIETSSKLPKPPKSKSRYFANDRGDGLTTRNPNRDTMFPGADLGRRRANDPA